VRRGARWALGAGAALIAIAAASRAGADVVPIDLNGCSASCLVPGVDDATADEEGSADDVALFGGRGIKSAGGARGDLVLDPKVVPPILVDGLPSPIASIGAETPKSPGVSPYAFFKEVVDIPLPIDPRTGLAAASIQLFTPSTIGRVTLTDVLSNSNELFKQPPRP
jgi:hypothetical protein